MGRYLVLSTTTQNITHVNGEAVTTTSVTDWSTGHAGWVLYDTSDPLLYPLMTCPNGVLNVTLSVDGVVTSQIFNGARPPQHPK